MPAGENEDRHLRQIEIEPPTQTNLLSLRMVTLSALKSGLRSGSSAQHLVIMRMISTSAASGSTVGRRTLFAAEVAAAASTAKPGTVMRGLPASLTAPSSSTSEVTTAGEMSYTISFNTDLVMLFFHDLVMLFFYDSKFGFTSKSVN